MHKGCRRVEKGGERGGTKYSLVQKSRIGRIASESASLNRPFPVYSFKNK
jgi:hypothetical protein